MWQSLFAALLSVVPVFDFDASKFDAQPAAVVGLKTRSIGAASFGSSVVSCSGPAGETFALFIGDRGGTQDAVEEVGAVLLCVPSRDVIRRVRMPGDRRTALRLRPLLDLDGDGWNDIGELQGASTAPICDRSAIVRSGRTGEALWSARRFAEVGERSGRPSLFRGWLGTGMEDFGFLTDIDEDGVSDLVVLAESLAVWSGAESEALWVRDAKDLPLGTDKELTFLPSAGGGERVAVSGLGGFLDIFAAETGQTLWRHRALQPEPAHQSHIARLVEAAVGSADLDGDGVPDDLVSFCIAGDARGGEVSAFSSATGERLWTVEAEAESEPGFGSACAAIGDMNGDGICDYAIGAASAGTVTLLSGSNGGVLWKRRRVPGFGESLVTLPDLDGDGVLELAAGLPPVAKSPGGAVVILKGSNGRQWLRIEPPR